MAEACFQMKSSTVAAVVLDIHHYSAEDFLTQLQQKIESAPMFFQRAAVVFDLSSFQTEINGPLPADELEQLVTYCREQGLQPIACRGAEESLFDTISALGLASLPAVTTRKVEIPTETQALDKSSADAEEDTAPEDIAAIEEQAELPLASSGEEALAETAENNAETIVETVTVISHRPSKVVTKPVRSGQQVYAEGADLILMAPVSEGAEVLADGHIHVYGTLRGRALAGVKGDLEARIFCQQLEAELVSVAGQFVLNDKIRESCWKKPAQIYLQNESIQVEEI